MPRLRQRIRSEPDHAEILQFLLPPLRPPARREQSCPFVAKEGSPAHLPLPEMRQAGTGDGADRPADKILLGSLRTAVLEAFGKSKISDHRPFVPLPELRNLCRNYRALRPADSLLQRRLPPALVFSASKQKNTNLTLIRIRRNQYEPNI